MNIPDESFAEALAIRYYLRAPMNKPRPETVTQEQVDAIVAHFRMRRLNARDVVPEAIAAALISIRS